MTGADELNLLCSMTAHGINPNIHTIARICNPDYTDQVYKMQKTFALSLTVNPEKQAAIEIERLLKFPGFLKRDSFAKGRVEIVELRVDERSRLCNVALSELNRVIKCRVLVCAVLRRGDVVAPDGSFVLREGDRIFVTASTESLATLLDNLGFTDNYMECMVPTGGVYPIATANNKDQISAPLMSRFAVIDIPDYTKEEKMIIFTKFSLPKVLRRMGLREGECIVTPEAVEAVVDLYAHTTGIRDLEQAAEHIAANALYRIEVNKVENVTFDVAMVKELFE